MSNRSRTSHFQSLFDAALEDYRKQTGTKLVNHPLCGRLSKCDTVESITAVLQEQAQVFLKFRGKDGKIMGPLKCAVHVLHSLSDSMFLGEAIALPFPPATAVFAGFAVLFGATKDIEASYDMLVDLLESIEHFLKRLDIYVNIPPTPAMTGIFVKILVELLSTLGLVTKQIKQKRLVKFVKALFGENKVQAALQRLDRLTNDEVRVTLAQTLMVVKDMKAVMDDGKLCADGILETASETTGSDRDPGQVQSDVQDWLSAPDPWDNHNKARSLHQSGTAEWFINGETYAEWTSSNSSPVLWIHGKPGSGKTILCSTIVQEIETMRADGLASLAFFYCDHKDDQKNDRFPLLSSLLVQLCDQSDAYREALSKLYAEHESGFQDPSDDTLTQCLKSMLVLPDQVPVYIIIDALDECPHTDDMPSPRDKVLGLVKELVELQVPEPNLRICVTSRPEADIRPILGSFPFRSISLHDEDGQMQDIADYIKSVVNMDHIMGNWRPELKELVIEVLTRKADKMFRWVHSQMVDLRKCRPERIRRALDRLSAALDETYERALQMGR